jgi:5-(carboxyamino)imidazole ribonucleotide synthase
MTDTACLNSPILPPALLGILGGGQLGLYFTLAAKRRGYRVCVLDPDVNSPAGQVADQHLCAAFDDKAALSTLAHTCAAISTEFENIDVNSMRYLEGYTRVSPSAHCVAIAQNRAEEKKWMRRAGLKTAPYLELNTLADCDVATNAANFVFPALLKTTRMGYDGKGQITVNSLAELRSAYLSLGDVACVLEERLALKQEISVILARSDCGEIQCFPVAENQHVNGILKYSIVPARISAQLADKAVEMAKTLAQQLNYVGVLTLELFVLDNGDLVVNEIAPRPHNSGHYSMDACLHSQFDQQVLTLCGFKPRSTVQHHPAVMFNLLGDLWCANSQRPPNFVDVLNEAELYLYGKTSAKKGRKMGHVTVLAKPEDDIEATLIRAVELQKNCIFS